MYTYSGCVGCGLSSAASIVPYGGYGQAEEELAWFSFEGIDDQAMAQMLAQGIASLVRQLGGITTADIWQDGTTGLWGIDVTSTPFLVTSPTTITSPWVSDMAVVMGEEMLDAIGQGFVELVRYVDDINRSLEVATSNHRIDIRFSVTVYPPVGTVAPEEEEVIEETIVGPVEDGEKKTSTWFIVGGIAAGVLAIGGVIGAVVWARKKR